MAKAYAMLNDRDYVIPEDVKAVYPATITHRLLLTPEAKAGGTTARSIVDKLIASTPAPAVK